MFTPGLLEIDGLCHENRRAHKIKAYGLKVIEYPDVGDIQMMGSKSSVGRFRSKSGQYKSYIRRSVKKRAVRRFWKRKARIDGRKQCDQRP